MKNLTIHTLLKLKEDLTVTYIVKNKSSKDKLEIALRNSGKDPFHRIFVDERVDVKGSEIGYRIEAPSLIEKDKNGKVKL